MKEYKLPIGCDVPETIILADGDFPSHPLALEWLRQCPRDHAGRFLKDTAAGRNTGNPCSPYGWGFPAPPCGAAALSQA